MSAKSSQKPYYQNELRLFGLPRQELWTHLTKKTFKFNAWLDADSLGMGPISKSVTLNKEGKAWQEQTLYLIGPNCLLEENEELWLKYQGSYSQHFFFYVTNEWAQ
jgi:hypothetical protein